MTQYTKAALDGALRSTYSLFQARRITQEEFDSRVAKFRRAGATLPHESSPAPSGPTFLPALPAEVFAAAPSAPTREPEPVDPFAALDASNPTDDQLKAAFAHFGVTL